MTRESVLHRHKQLVLTDWKQRAEERMQEADFEAKDVSCSAISELTSSLITCYDHLWIWDHIWESRDE